MASIMTYKLKDRVKGDTFESIDIEFLHGTGLPIDLTGATIEATFNYGCLTGIPRYTPSIGSGITITDALNGLVRIDSFTPLAWEVGTYYYSVTITFTSGEIHTYLKGSVKVISI